MGANVEIHVPISPTESFFQQVRYLAVSLRRYGGRLKDAPLIVTVGEDCEPFDIARKLPWSGGYGIEFRWVPRPLFQRHGYYATALQRYGYRFEKDYVLLLDADMVFSRDLDDLLDRAAADPALYALIAHGSPWQNSRLLTMRSDEDWWRAVFEAAGMGEPPLVCEYFGYGVLFNGENGVRRCPPYFNQGVVLSPASVMETVSADIYREMETANRVVQTFYRVQVALTLAVLRQGVAWRMLPLRYNFAPALMPYVPVMPEEWKDARIIHYSTLRWFPKDLYMENPAAMVKWFNGEGGDEVETYCRDLFRSLHGEAVSCSPGSRQELPR